MTLIDMVIEVIAKQAWIVNVLNGLLQVAVFAANIIILLLIVGDNPRRYFDRSIRK